MSSHAPSRFSTWLVRSWIVLALLACAAGEQGCGVRGDPTPYVNVYPAKPETKTGVGEPAPVKTPDEDPTKEQIP